MKLNLITIALILLSQASMAKVDQRLLSGSNIYASNELIGIITATEVDDASCAIDCTGPERDQTTSCSVQCHEPMRAVCLCGSETSYIAACDCE